MVKGFSTLFFEKRLKSSACKKEERRKEVMVFRYLKGYPAHRASRFSHSFSKKQK